MAVVHLSNSEINRSKWDDCIKRSFNSQIFGYTWFLDAVCCDWEALVDDDYEMVMPLPITKKYGVKMVVNPPLLIFVSIYSRVKPAVDRFYDFINAIPYRNVKINLLPFNGFPQFSLLPPIESGFASFDLIMDYESVLKRFDLLFDDSKCKEYINMSVVRTQNLEDYLQFKTITTNGKPSDNTKLKRLLSYALRFKSVGLYFCFDMTNSSIAALAVAKSDNRLTVIDTAVLNNPRSRCALYNIMRHIVLVHAETNLVLWFPSANFSFSENAEPQIVQGVQYRRGFLRFL
jgi:hypothetical protein